MSKLPEKLIAVGMRHIPGAKDNVNRLKVPQNVLLTFEANSHATGAMAIAVIHRGQKLAYIREVDLPMLKAEMSFSSLKIIPTCSQYSITDIRENYLVLKRTTAKEGTKLYYGDSLINITGSTNIGEISLKDNKVIPVSPEIQKTLNKKDENMFDKIVANNKSVAVNAAYMEAGRIANNQVTKLVAAKAPLMVKGYVDTPVGKVVLANLTAMAVEQFRPTDVKLKKVSVAMMTQAYQELIQTVDIEGMLNELTSSDGIKAALAAVSVNDEVKV
jgi:hypothetical protein